MITKLKRILFPKRYKIQTFTYYIPSPPERDSGYREKQFDKVFFDFINQDLEIISINTVPNTGPNSSGMWFVATVRGNIPLKLEEEIKHFSVDEIHLDDLESSHK